MSSSTIVKTRNKRPKRIYREDFDIRKLAMPAIDLREYIKEDELDELAQSIEDHGMINPLIITTVGRGYELVAGGRRVRAGLKKDQFKQPAFIYDNLGDHFKIVIQTIENIHQADFEPIWEARAYRIMMDRDGKSIEQIADEVKKPESRIRNRLKLLGLDPEVQRMVQRHELPSTTASVIAEIDDKEAQKALAQEVKDAELSYDVVKRMVKDAEIEARRKRQQEQARKKKEREQKERQRQTRPTPSSSASAGKSAPAAKPSGTRQASPPPPTQPTAPKASPAANHSSPSQPPKPTAPPTSPKPPNRPHVNPASQQEVKYKAIALKGEEFVKYLNRINLTQFDSTRLRNLHLFAYRLEQEMRNFGRKVSEEKEGC